MSPRAPIHQVGLWPRATVGATGKCGIPVSKGWKGQGAQRLHDHAATETPKPLGTAITFCVTV